MFDELVREQRIQDDESCLVVVPENEADPEYIYYMARYVLDSTDIDVVEAGSGQEENENVYEKAYDRVIRLT